ncbi:MAG: nucleotidyl transferase AbiEii/AbiGii toxin family protein [Chitinispirillales bacterium]|nr:nucleotidyl transferase AbiEii/AbiGii toxin family protein [Chitinispirillales bacterium]
MPKTAEILQKISKFDCIKDYVVMGGTALSLQINNRMSEDIDFCRWKTAKREKLAVNISQIEKEFGSLGIFKRELLGDNQVDYMVNGVKITFFCDNFYKQPTGIQHIPFLNNIKLADMNSIGIMKLEVMLRRSKFRDYYDIFSIIKSGGDFNKIVDGVLQYTNHSVRSRDILSMLADGNRFTSEMNIKYLSPRYTVSYKDIEIFLFPYIQNYNNKLIV